MHNKPTFRQWLAAQRDRHDPVGDLARDVKDDKALGKRQFTPTELYEHVRSVSGYEPALEAAKAAAEEYGKPIKLPDEGADDGEDPD